MQVFGFFYNSHSPNFISKTFDFKSFEAMKKKKTYVCASNAKKKIIPKSETIFNCHIMQFFFLFLLVLWTFVHSCCLLSNNISFIFIVCGFFFRMLNIGFGMRQIKKWELYLQKIALFIALTGNDKWNI